MRSVIESTADNLMALFQANRQEVNDKKTRTLILGELNKLKDSLILFDREQRLAELVSILAVKSESDSSELVKVPHVLKQESPSTHSLHKKSGIKPRLGIKPDPKFSHFSPKILHMHSTPRVLKQKLLSRESDTKPKRPHPDPQFGHSSPKIPRMSSTLRVRKKELPSTHSSGKKSYGKTEIGVKRPHKDPQFSRSSLKIPRMSSPPRVPKKESFSSHSFRKESDAKPKVGTKRLHPDPRFSHFSLKIPQIIMSPIATAGNNKPKVIDLTSDIEEDKKSMSKPKHSASNVTEISGHVTGITTKKTFMVSPSDKTASGYVPELDKPPTSLTTIKKHTLIVKSTKSSKEGVQKEHKQPLKRPRASSKVTKPQRRVKPGGKRIHKIRCTEKIKKFCRVCSKPDCGECKNCL